MISVSQTVTAQNMYTDSIAPHDNEKSQRCGHLTLSISGTWTGTVVLQRSFDNGDTWITLASYTTNQDISINDKTTDILYRAGCATGNYTSGTINIILAK